MENRNDLPVDSKDVVPPMGAATKDVDAAIEHSVQPRAHAQVLTGHLGLLNYLSSSSYRIAPYWSPQRDSDLDAFWKESDPISAAMGMLSAKIVTIPVQVLPRNTRVAHHQKEAEEFTIRLNEESEYGRGWMEAVSKWLTDWWASDNGAFLEVIGDGKPDGPIEGPALGIAHMDSLRCQRTGDPEFPVLYLSPNGGYTAMHRSRVAFASDMPSSREELLGVGHCALSRSIQNAQTLIDIANYKLEKLGSRPLRGILQGRGISTDAILAALAVASEQMDSRGLNIYSQMPVLGNIPPDASLDMLDLAGLPDGYNEETTTRLGMFSLALAFGVPIRWIWPASVSGATKADAMYQHIAGLGGGLGRILRTLTLLLGGDARGLRHSVGKFLPPHLKLVFDFQDDEQDRNHAEIKSKRAANRNSNLESGVIDVRTAREQALGDGDITQGQFNKLELEDGRLPDGSPVTGLFHDTHEPFVTWLDLGIPNPLAVSANDPVDMLAEINEAAITVTDAQVNAPNINTREKAEQALSALNALKAMYAPLAQQAVQRDIMSRWGGQTVSPTTLPGAEDVNEQQADMATTPEEEAQEQKSLSMSTKQFDYGVGVGEVIQGQLARGPGGRFINIDELMGQVRAGMLDRLKASQSNTSINSASAKRAANRAALAERMGIPGDTLESLAGMKTGSTSLEAEQALVGKGLATVNADGSISMSGAGRSLLSAANSGDVDKAEQALSKASQAGKGKGKGKKPAKSPEQRRAEREERERKEREANRMKVAEQMEERISQEDFSALAGFADGGELSPTEQTNLASQGLVEIDADGNARMTSAGRSLMSAANKGDARNAKDALSAGADRVDATHEKVSDARDKANDYDAKGEAAMQRGEERAAKYEQQAATVRDQFQTYAEGLDKSINEYQSKADTYAAKSDELDNEADAMDAAINSARSDDERKRLQERQADLRDRADRGRKAAETLRSEAKDYSTQRHGGHCWNISAKKMRRPSTPTQLYSDPYTDHRLPLIDKHQHQHPPMSPIHHQEQPGNVSMCRHNTQRYDATYYPLAY
jgi:uncharacterized membrane-anchored protein YhcB (DUF1043 family)